MEMGYCREGMIEWPRDHVCVTNDHVCLYQIQLALTVLEILIKKKKKFFKTQNLHLKVAMVSVCSQKQLFWKRIAVLTDNQR